MSLPYVFSEEVWNLQDEDATVALKSEFERCKVVVVEITTAAFSGTIDLKGKAHELNAFSNVPYIRQDQASIQTPSVAQISHTTDTGVYRYAILGYWRRLQLVMTCTAGTITCGVVGSSDALPFPSAGHGVTAIGSGRKVVAAAGTAETLVATSTPAKYVIITSETNNTGMVVYGASNVDETLASRIGVPLTIGESSHLIPCDDLLDIYLDVGVTGDGVTYTYFN